MGKRRSVPEDLMGTILGQSFDAEEVHAPSEELGGSPAVPWEERPERVGVTFNLSKQLAAELERLRWDLRSGDDVRPSRSELVEVALRIVAEDVRQRGEESELYRRLAGRGGTTRRSVDDSGWIFETTYDGNGQVVDEDVVGTVADLPVTDEYVDEQGRLVSVAEDGLGNTFEQTMDEEFNVLETRLLPARDRDAR